MTRQDRFLQRKQHILHCLSVPSCDNSPKASVDTAALPIIALLNSHPHYVTTSSCSGRLVVFAEAIGASGEQDGWLLVAHEEVEDQAFGALGFAESEQPLEYGDMSTLVSLKFEPFILHVEAATI